MLRATLRGLLSRKLRLVLSALAVVLGVMFVSGAFVLTDSLSRSFDGLFSDAYSDVDIQVSARTGEQDGADDQTGGRATVPASLVDDVKAVPGVADAAGEVRVDGARVVGTDGKIVGSVGTPRVGSNWRGETSALRLRDGRGPTAETEVAINGTLARLGGFSVGDEITVLTLEPKQTFTVVGVFGYSQDRDSLSGETNVAFTTPTAQRLLLGVPDNYTDIAVAADPGVSADVLAGQIGTALDGRYQVATGKDLTRKSADEFRESLKFLNYIFLGFAGVALFVATFLILNTFSIIVAQRTHELALLRAVGASRGQLVGSVLVEAAVIGVFASGIGLGAGVGVGALIGYAYTKVGGSDLTLSISVSLTAVLASFAVGTLITVLAAIGPAFRAARVPPVAAMRTMAATDRPLTSLIIWGGRVSMTGAGVFAAGVTGRIPGKLGVWLTLGGILACFVGIALLTPLIARPIVSFLGKAFAWSMPGELGRRNSARNPRRTAITAAALMVGIALVTGISVVLSSAKASIASQVNTQLAADLLIGGEQGSQGSATFDPEVVDETRKLAGVRAAVAIYTDVAQADGKTVYLRAVDDVDALRQIFTLPVSSGDPDELDAGKVLVDEDTARGYGVSSGDQVRIKLPRGEPRLFTVVAVYRSTDLISGWLFSSAEVSDFRTDSPSQAFVKLTDRSDAPVVKREVSQLLEDSPDVSVQDRTEYIKQLTATLDRVLKMIEILLTLAIVVAALGVVNTLALSVLERTHEFGLLRAIGMRRGQVMRMVTVESVVISLFGGLLGLVVGSVLGAGVVQALKEQGFTELDFSFTQMGTYLLLAAVIGVLAAVLPAIRAARLDVLESITAP